MYDPVRFFNPSYLFDFRPYTYPQTIKAMALFFIAFTIVAIGIKIWGIKKKPQGYVRKLADKYISFFSWMSVFGLIITLTRYERANLLAGRFWLVIWLIGGLWWLYTIYKYQSVVVPQAKKQAEQKQQFQKYLPSKK